MALANKVKIGLAFLKLGIYHGVYFDCIEIINLRGYIDQLDTSVNAFVNHLLWFVFHFMLFAQLSSWPLVSFAGFQGLSYLHEFYFILFIHHNILFNFELCTYCKIGDIYLHYDAKDLSYNPGLQYPHLHGPVHTPDNNRWDAPPV